MEKKKRIVYLQPIQRDILRDSSMVEHSAVNRRVVGSNPTRGAEKRQKYLKALLPFPVYRKFCKSGVISMSEAVSAILLPLYFLLRTRGLLIPHHYHPIPSTGSRTKSCMPQQPESVYTSCCRQWMLLLVRRYAPRDSAPSALHSGCSRHFFEVPLSVLSPKRVDVRRFVP